jgi:hypothetical protein
MSDTTVLSLRFDPKTGSEPDSNSLCAGSYWINNNIVISNGGFSVDIPATISLNVTNTGKYFPAKVNHAQAVVCALNTSYHFNSATILPSVPMPHGLVYDKGDELGLGQTANQPGTPAIVLPRWTPTAQDGNYFVNKGVVFEKGDLHVCVVANCDGTVVPNGVPEGTYLDWTTFADDTGFCTDKHHGQLNTTLHRTLSELYFTAPFMAVAPPHGPREGDTAKVFLREQVFDPQADQGLVEMIRRAGLDGLPIQAARVPARTAGIARVGSVAERIEQKAEEIVNDARELLREHWADEDDESGLGTPRNVLTLQLAPGELLPLLMKVAFDKDDALGTVHVFDVIQLNKDGTRGGFRLATIHTPAE